MPYIKSDFAVTDELLKLIAHVPTKSLQHVVEPGFFQALSDTQFMRIAVLLAQKSDEEGGCPIGGLIVNNDTRQIVGKGHNTLIQEDHPYNHGETSAIRDAGRIDFSKTTIFTTLSPCDVCTALVYMRGFNRIVVGNVTSANGNEKVLAEKGIIVDILEDKLGVDIYEAYRKAKPQQDLEDWKGLAAC